ncbi:DNA methyltransferase [Cellulomonas chengniuliangii]|uniref:Site-specific DNA-methyltransferase n=1 Tax=Cellulomonas chengniuliangii TaxID=2968084 RepID=A0ABY5KYK7_9CELL|nr:DNA methyltransferase [Cellulomonas chengniuliangii]MCC2309164.1 site-specific DNA-methyltransferase [Cellulomonas chengniuliangii]UUI75254.1 site-specific DNA-methyltransferase [Cellulomonas chengniuliangii]
MTDQLFQTDDQTARELEGQAALDQLRMELESGNIALPPGQSIASVLAMSSPPWHTATVNPFMRDWSMAGPRGDVARDDPGPYLDDVQGSKNTLQYKAHSYPTKVPPEVIVRLLLHYTKPGDVVLDGFAGSGMTGVAAQMCATPDQSIGFEFAKHGRTAQWGARRAVLNDLAPNATFLASGVTLPVDAEAFSSASAALLKRLDDELGWMYRTTTPDGHAALIDYTVWSEVFTCPHCGGAVVFYDTAFSASTGKVRDVFPCPGCGAAVGKKSSPPLERRKVPVRLLTGEVIERVELRPVRVHYRWRMGNVTVTGNKPLDDADRAVLARVASLTAPGAPSAALPISAMVHGSRLAPKGFTAVQHLYADRALASLSRLWTWAVEEPRLDIRRALKFWVEQAFWGLSWMNRYKATDHSQVNRAQSGVYYVSSLISECSPRYNLEGTEPKRGKRSTLVKLWQSVPPNADIRITTGDASALPLEDASVDYAFVDPPFGENIPYSDLAHVIEGWHGVLTQVEREAIVDKARGKSNREYADLMTACFKEFSRVLKPGRWMTVEFSNSSNVVWAALQEALTAAGFVVADTRVLDKTQDSYRQATAVNAVKQDLMISCYKPDAATTASIAAAGGADPTVWAFVGEHLKHLPVVHDTAGVLLPVRERHSDRIYHRVVSYYVSAGLPVPMTASEFYRGLDAHYNERDDMYFRPDQVETYERKKMTFKELASVQLFVTDETSAVSWLRQQLKRKPQKHSQIQPDYLREISTSGDRPDQLPDLRELLEQNFVQDSDGAWAVPDPRKSEHLDQLRQRDLLRTFDSYASDTGPLHRFRGEAVLAGFRNAWAKSEYDTIVKVAKRLPPDYLVEMPAVLAYVRNARSRLGQ